MNEQIAYRCLRNLCGTHANVKRTRAVKMSFRYDEIATVTASAIRAAARAAARKSDLSRALDLKTKHGKGNVKDAERERDILSRIACCADAELDDSMQMLLNFYESLYDPLSSLSEIRTACHLLLSLLLLL